MRSRLAALSLAVLVAGAPAWAACAHAHAAWPFEVVPRRVVEKSSHRTAYLTALAGVTLVAASSPLEHEADRRYAEYLAETDVSQIDEKFRATQRMDRIASGSLLAGEALLATAVWLRFVHHPSQQHRASLVLRPDRCALSLRF